MKESVHQENVTIPYLHTWPTELKMHEVKTNRTATFTVTARGFNNSPSITDRTHGRKIRTGITEHY